MTIDDCRLKKGMIGRISGWLDEWMVNKGNPESAESADGVEGLDVWID